ncbi:hypothetical protein [Aquipuribacter nitratireducens]|uniref:Uncharacterized protein n=1 Tax=Aquipuribacter nitratireducens TaxID=650104 RepID=A0ABW0GNR8_9MICO
MTLLLALLLVPVAALGLVLGMDRVEDTLLKAPARHRSAARGVRRPVDAAPAPTSTHGVAA